MMGLTCDDEKVSAGKIRLLNGGGVVGGGGSIHAAADVSSSPGTAGATNCGGPQSPATHSRRRKRKTFNSNLSNHGFIQTHQWNQMRINVKQQNIHQLQERVKRVRKEDIVQLEDECQWIDAGMDTESAGAQSIARKSMKQGPSPKICANMRYRSLQERIAHNSKQLLGVSENGTQPMSDDVQAHEASPEPHDFVVPQFSPEHDTDSTTMLTPLQARSSSDACIPQLTPPLNHHSNPNTAKDGTEKRTPDKRKAETQLVDNRPPTRRRLDTSVDTAPSLLKTPPAGKSSEHSSMYYCRSSEQSEDIAVPGADLTEMTEKTFGFPRLSNVYFLKEYKRLADQFKWEYWNMRSQLGRKDPALPSFIVKKLARNPMRRVNGVQYVNPIKEEHLLCMEDDVTVTYNDIEQEYWNIVEHDSHKVIVQYGSDLDAAEVGSLFPKGWDNDWNMNRLAITKDSLLHYLFQKIPGVSSPMMYVGMMFSSFCWHTEDNYLPATNFIHYGAKKTWYGVPGSSAVKFESVMRKELNHLYDDNPNLIHGMITQLSPRVLQENGVPVYTIEHEPGTFIITLPRVFHAGFNHGFNVAESINFAPSCWVPSSRIAVKNYRQCKRATAFSHDKIFCNVVEHLVQFDNESAEAICNELKVIVEIEKGLRAKVEHAGITTVKTMPTRSRRRSRFCKSDSDRDYFFCCECNQDCYLSSISCPCLTKKASSEESTTVFCLHHFDACQCDPSHKILNIRYTQKQLEELSDKANENFKMMKDAAELDKQ